MYLQSLKIFKHEEGYFVVKLDSRIERDAILFAGPHLFFLGAYYSEAMVTYSIFTVKC